MKISAVIENTSACGLAVEHGLCLWIEACGRRFFFDLGQSGLFAENARAMGIDAGEAEFAIVSHGHYDHGGGIRTFLSLNHQAPIFLNAHAFCDCYSLKQGRARYIGLDKELRGSERIVFVDGVQTLSPGLILFAGSKGRDFFSPANSRILKKTDGGLFADDFLHEQSLVIIEGDRRVLVAGCAHSGILNIMARAEEIIGQPLTDVIAGMHLAGVEDPAFIDNLSRELKQRPCQYLTCHCTGEPQFQRMKTILGRQIGYLSGGDVVSIC